MKKLKPAVRVTELGSFCDVTFRVYDAESEVQKDERLALIISELKKISADLTSAINKEKVLSALDDADKKRDDIIRDFGTLCEGYTALPNLERKQGAKKIFEVFSRYGKKMTDENYAAESKLVESFLEDFSASQMSALVSQFEGMNELLQGLRSAQDEFNSMYDKNKEARTIAKGENSASEIKQVLINKVNGILLPYVEVLAKTSKDVFGHFSSLIDDEIAQMNATVSARSRKSKQQEA